MFTTSSTRKRENEVKNPTNMFEFYHKNPKHLKARSVREIKFDVDQELAVEKEKAEREPPAIQPEKATWSEGCKRVGAVGVKLGMMPLWLKSGQRVPVTLVQVMYIDQVHSQQHHRMVASCQFYRLVATCHLHTCYNFLKPLAESL